MKSRNPALLAIVVLTWLLSTDPALAGEPTTEQFKTQLHSHIDRIKSGETIEINTLVPSGSQLLSTITSGEEYRQCVSPNVLYWMAGQGNMCMTLYRQLEIFRHEAFKVQDTPGFDPLGMGGYDLNKFKEAQRRPDRQLTIQLTYLQLSSQLRSAKNAIRSAFVQESNRAYYECRSRKGTAPYSCYVSRMQDFFAGPLQLVAEAQKAKLAADCERAKTAVSLYAESASVDDTSAQVTGDSREPKTARSESVAKSGWGYTAPGSGARPIRY